MKRVIIVLAVAALLVIPLSAVQGQNSNVYIHTVGTGQTLTSIAALYNVNIITLKDANKLTKDSVYIGQKLLIPLTRPLIVHTVVRGESLLAISQRYGVSSLSIAWANNLSNPSLIYVGQKLVIPPLNTSMATPKVTAQATITPPAVQEAIVITSPLLNSRITSPLTISGWGSGYENTLNVSILDETGRKIGSGSVTVSAEFGQYGPFIGSVTFTMPSKAQVGKVQVYSVSARDGSVDHLNSIMVKFQP